MKRRTLLKSLQAFCVAHGIEQVLSSSVRADAGPTRMVNFITKYTGGTTMADGVGQWHTQSSLAPLAPFAADLTVPLGLRCDFHAPMNSHAAPQVCALSGAMTGFVLRETHYPKGNLQNVSTGEGRSIDVLIGEKLQAAHKSALPLLSIGNDNKRAADPTMGSSSWTNNGALIPAHTNLKDLAEELRSHRPCDQLTDAAGRRRLRALQQIRATSEIFESRYLIDRAKFEKVVEVNQKAIESTENQTLSNEATDAQACDAFWSRYIEETAVNDGSESDTTRFMQKMELMFDLAFRALELNITRVVTFNFHEYATHGTSHYQGVSGAWERYVDLDLRHQVLAARFMERMRAAGMYEDTLFYGNAGTCATNNVHNYENLATYVVNGGFAAGNLGSVSRPLPVGSLLVDLLNQFGFGYSEYGGRDHKLGVGKPGQLR